ncbi:MAG: 50S ribosomal protein L35 [Spirochaetes bacterium GWD1_27_9]|nr:MAG: 50S ribosomal protein L35 [Spirochaetes bacterium GWB1_27_13]OHD23014.1 MAG: 50S ribosomal protein L35 [Spirochaetes bacterium GWC1_27_15]OHD39609.1 MAG: 50S ribosomal protein L35 [Spirochaetes bacterium GWD1_27_9]
MAKVKVKSKRSAAKRFKVTKNGKVLYSKQGRRHLLSVKSSKRKRQLGKTGVLKECEAKRVRSLLPYG